MLENKKHRPTSVFKMPAMTADVAKEQARINAEKAKGMTILEAYDCKFGSGSYRRDFESIQNCHYEPARLHDPFFAIRYSEEDANFQAINEHKYFQEVKKGVYDPPE